MPVVFCFYETGNRRAPQGQPAARGRSNIRLSGGKQSGGARAQLAWQKHLLLCERGICDAGQKQISGRGAYFPRVHAGCGKLGGCQLGPVHLVAPVPVLRAAQAYLLGSIDTGILVSKCLYHDDVRNYGSGAAGMTNMLRTFGKKAAALTAAGDVLKGVAAVCIGRWLFGFLPADAAVSPYLGVYMTAILAVIGHSKPIYFGFKGGKGVLVAGGAILAIQPILLPFLTAVFLLCLIPTGMVSLGSITMAAAYPVLTLIYGLLKGFAAGDLAICVVGALIMGGMVIYMHRANIQRIRAGKEYRFGQKHKKN